MTPASVIEFSLTVSAELSQTSTWEFLPIQQKGQPLANAIRICPTLSMLKMGNVNAYLLQAADGLVLVDAGWPNKADVIFEAVRDAGHDPLDIRHVVLTHGHIDHAGSAAEVIHRTGARSYAHAGDVDLISSGNAEHPGTTITPGLIPKLVHFFFIRPGGTHYTPFSVDETLTHGQRLPMAPDVEVIHSPGHSAGHVALLLRDEGILIGGDICSNVMGLGYSVINEDRSLARSTLLRVAEYPFERAVFGHGGPLEKDGNKCLRERFIIPKLA